MYSLILMTAMVAGPDASAFGKRMAGGGCCGGVVASYGCCGGAPVSAGCCGGYATSCTGCCGGGYAASCHGCCGGGGGFLSHHKAKKAARYAGSCTGSGCGGSCWGSCYGSWAGEGYGYGSGCGGGGCGGVILGTTYDVPGVIYNTPMTTTPMMTVPMTPTPAPAPSVIPTPKPSTTTDKEKSGSMLPTPAQLTIELPAGAKLLVDGQPTRGTGPTRQFHTPVLPLGEAFFYEMRAEVMVNGKLEVEEKRVVVRAGDSFTESFARLTAVVAAAKPTAVASK